MAPSKSFFYYRRRFPELYGSTLRSEEEESGSSSSIPIPELVEELTEKTAYDGGDDSDVTSSDSWALGDAAAGLEMSTELLRVMRASLHPPHKLQSVSGRRRMTKVPNAAIPYCYYQDKDDEGVRQGPYDARYCDSFQVGIFFSFCIHVSAVVFFQVQSTVAGNGFFILFFALYYSTC